MFGVTDLGNIFKPEVSPIHKRVFSIATVLKLETAELAGLEIVKAGTVLYSKGAGAVKDSPELGATITKGAATASGVLMHDVVIEKGIKDYAIGVLVDGVVYDDVMASVNTAWETEKTDLEASGITTYKVKTLRA